MIDVPVMPFVAGIVGAAEVPIVPIVEGTLIVGAAIGGLTPRLPIWVDPNGIPVRAAPPGAVGDVDIGLDDEAILPEPEPHIPDNPDVSDMPEVVDIPDVAGSPDDDIGIPDIAPVAGGAAPTTIPPPSRVAVDPSIPKGEVPMVEQFAPLPGMAIAPGTPAGAGLMPGDGISVEPRGMPVGETVVPVSMPSGEVAPMVGVGSAIPPTWAKAALQTRSAERIAGINESLIGVFHLEAASPWRAPASVSIAASSLAPTNMASSRELFN